VSLDSSSAVPGASLPIEPSQRLIPLEARAEWEAALEGIPHDFGHGWEGANAYHITMNLPIRLYEFVAGDLRVVCPIVERAFGEWTDITTPHGFTGFVGVGSAAAAAGSGAGPEFAEFARLSDLGEHSHLPDFSNHWLRFARAQGWVCGYLALHPILPNAVQLPEARTHNHVYHLDLRQSLDTLRAGLSRNRRRELKAWEASGRSLVRDRERLTEFLVREYPRFLERVGAPAGYARTPQALRYLCGSERTILVGTEEGGEVRSVYVFVHTEAIGTCLHYVSLPDARDLASVLLWTGVRELRERGVAWLNLGGGLQDRDTIARSKERYGAVARLLQAVQQVYRPDVYETLCRTVGVEPDRPGFFPAYRASSAAARPVDPPPRD